MKEPKCYKLDGSLFSTSNGQTEVVQNGNKLVLWSWQKVTLLWIRCISLVSVNCPATSHVFSLCAAAVQKHSKSIYFKPKCCHIVYPSVAILWPRWRKTAFNLVPVRTHATWCSADLAPSLLQSTVFVWLIYWATVATWKLEEVQLFNHDGCHRILIKTKLEKYTQHSLIGFSLFFTKNYIRVEPMPHIMLFLSEH